jgi:uncharacterized protein YbaP (TraB family)
MRKILTILLCLALLMGTAACGGVSVNKTTENTPSASLSETAQPTEEPSPSPEPTPEPTAETVDYVKATADFAQLLIDGDFESCSEMFSPMLSAQIDAEGLKQMWETTVKDCGAFVKMDEARAYTRPYSVYSYTTVFCEFENNGVAVTALYGDGGQLMSLLMNYYLPLSRLIYETESNATPILWKVTSPDGDGEMYLMGSIHVADALLYSLPKEIMNAYDSCDALALEYDLVDASLDFTLYMQAQMGLMYQDGTKITDHISQETYNKAAAFLTEQGTYNAMFDYFQASTWNSIVGQAVYKLIGYDMSYGVDMYFCSLAHAVGKEVLSIESQQFQLDMLTEAPDNLWDFYISYTIDKYNAGENPVEDLYSAYFNGDEAALMEQLYNDYDLSDPILKDYTEEELALLVEQDKAFDEIALTQRNVSMIEKAVEYLESGRKVFFLVGMAHMLGDDGIVAGLTAAGYTVERVEY